MDDLGEVLAAELDRREVDRDVSGNLSVGGVAAGGAQRPFAHLKDRFGLFGQRNEFRRRNHAELRMTPSHQGFGAADLAVVERSLKLVMQDSSLRAVAVSRSRASARCARAAVVHLALYMQIEPRCLLLPRYIASLALLRSWSRSGVSVGNTEKPIEAVRRTV